MRANEQDQNRDEWHRECGSRAERYEEGFKRQAVEHWLRSGKNGTQIAKELGISYPSLKEWKRRYAAGRSGG